MARLNRKPKVVRTHEGAPDKRITPEQELRRSVMSCLLWEDTFYENGEDIATRIAEKVVEVSPETAFGIANEARNQMYLRHAPLWIAKNMTNLKSHRHLVRNLLNHIIQRPDELCEFLVMYWADGKKPLANQVKRGLADAIKKFDAYQLAKWDRKREVRLADVIKMCHPKPETPEQVKLWKQVLEGTLPVPDTWEVALSSGTDKKEAWTRLLKEKKLGGMALLMNLRNMSNAGVDEYLIKDYIRNMNVDKLLPFRFITAARINPQFEPELEEAMIRALKSHEKMPGKTVLLVDVSGSMDWSLSQNSTTTRIDAACGLAILLREICDDIDVYTFSTKLVRVPARRGFALRDAINSSQDHSSTYLGLAVKSLYAKKGQKTTIKGSYYGFITMTGQGLNPDRLIVITDEQSHDPVPDPHGKGYMINVASYKRGVGYHTWNHVDGWSPSVVKWIQTIEAEGF